MRYILLTVCFWSICFTLDAQQTLYYYNQDYAFDDAQSLYFNEAYRGAQYEFDKQLQHASLIDKQEEESMFYTAIVSLLYNDYHALSKYEKFEENYPNSGLSEQSGYALGSYYLHQKDYAKALQHLKQVNQNTLSKEKKDQIDFQMGYAYFMQSDFKKSKPYIQKLIAKEDYQEPAFYMMGHIEYAQENYPAALSYFEKVDENSAYHYLLEPYKLQIHFKNGEYEKAIALGKKLLAENHQLTSDIELKKIIGECEFQLKNYNAALPYLKEYQEKSEKSTLTDYYQLGFVYYKLGQYNEAVQQFNKITQQQSALGQNAFYQLGNSYLKVGQKKEALTAFKSSSEMVYDKNIAQDAHYKYAKLSYDLGNPFETVPDVLWSYLKAYPTSTHQSEIRSLLIDSYRITKNYPKALELLKNLPSKTQKEKEIEQKIALMYGLQLYNDRKFSDAIAQFNVAQQYKSPVTPYAQSLYWEAQSHYELGNYQESIASLLQLKASGAGIPESIESDYLLGYNYLKTKSYDKAIVSFQNYLSKSTIKNRGEAKMRLADAYYGAQNFAKAEKLYDEVYQESPGSGLEKDALFQKAVLLGLQQNFSEKIKALEDYKRNYPNSEKIEQVNYELGEAYFQIEDYSKSNQYFTQVINQNASYDWVALAKLARANNFALLNENQKAINEYKSIARDYKETDYAAQAIIAAKPVYIALADGKSYEKWAKENGYELSKVEAEELNFTIAQNYYLEKNYTQSIITYTQFLKDYPNSTRRTTAVYQLGNSYYLSDNTDKAEPYFKEIAKKPNDYQEEALAKLSSIYLKNGNDQEAKLALEALYEITQNEQYKKTVELELMYIYSDEGNHKKAAEMADKVLAQSETLPMVQEEAQVIRARYSYFSKDTAEAKKRYAALEKAKKSSVQAEALYYKSVFLFQEKKYEKSNEVIFKLSNDLASEQYWGAKALVQMANNYHQLKDNYQATYILESVRDNYPQYPDVVEQAKQLLANIKK